MKAIIVDTYGPPSVATLKEVPKPTIRKSNEILIRVMAASVNSGDARLRRADPWFVRLMFGFRGPRRKILGAVFAGVVESVGDAVTTYAPGDRVYGMPENFMGSHAEYLVVTTATPMGRLPAAMSFTDAAALPFGGTTALHFLKGIDLKDKTVLVNGASGAVGLCFLQIARHRGAQVTAVSSGKNLPLLRELGAARVVDYTATDILTLGEEFDVVIDCVNVIPLGRIETLVRPGGHIILLAGLLKEMFLSRKLKKATVRIGSAVVTGEQFDAIAALYAAGALKPVIEKQFQLTEIKAAYALVDSGRKVGTVVLNMHE